MSKIRVTVQKNAGDSRGSPILFKVGDYATFFKLATNKLRIKPKRFFNEYGDELLETDFKDPDKVKNDMVIYVSKGEDFAHTPKVKNTQQIVGLEGGQAVNKGCAVSVIAKESQVTNDAMKQLTATGKMHGMKYVVGMPDLHPGKGCAIGAACASSGVFYPALVGNDIGCGMSLYHTSLTTKNIKLDKWAKTLRGLDDPWNGDTKQFLAARGVEPTDFDAKSLGSIGGGNHFAELQQIEEVVDAELFEAYKLNDDSLYLCVHSGSRGFGAKILKDYSIEHGYKGIVDSTDEAKAYLKKHNHAMCWARCNRALIARRFLNCMLNVEEEQAQQVAENIGDHDIRKMPVDDQISDGSRRILDVWHNCVIPKQFATQDGKVDELWLHRKGAAPSDKGLVVIPGSRGAFSYLVQPVSDTSALQKGGFSLAHGAGRRWTRSKCRERGKNMNAHNLKTTTLGSKVICEDSDLLYEEMPDAYKDIQAVVNDLVSHGLVTIVAILRPLITYKLRAKTYAKK